MLAVLGLEVKHWRAEVSKYRQPGKVSRASAAKDLFVVPTIGFDLLYVLAVVRLARRDQCDRTPDGRMDSATNY